MFQLHLSNNYVYRKKQLLLFLGISFHPCQGMTKL